MPILYKNKEVLQNKKRTKMVEKSILRSIFQNKFEIFFIDTNSPAGQLNAGFKFIGFIVSMEEKRPKK